MRVSAYMLLAISLLGTGSACADASTDRMDELERRLDQSNQKVQALSNRIQELEQRPAAPGGAGTGDGLGQRIDELSQRLTALTNRSTLDDGLPMHGFASVGGVFTNQPGARHGATAESVDFYLAPQFGDRVRALFEVNAETDESGEVGVDLERLQLGYLFSDALTLWAGRFHTPYGYWNTAYHHGAQIQTSILRPRFLDFEDSGGILPAHTVGLWAHGTTRQGNSRIDYDGWLGNAPSISMDSATSHVGTLNPNLRGNLNANPVVGLKLGFTPDAQGGWTIGVHAYQARVGGPDDGDGSFLSRTLSQSLMLGGYTTYLEDDWEMMAEYYHLRDKNLRSGSATVDQSYGNWAAYAQLGRNLGRWTPYARLEKASLKQEDEYFAAQASGRSYRRLLAGVRYDLGSRSALKFEADRTHQADPADPTDSSTPAPGHYNEVRLQFAVRF